MTSSPSTPPQSSKPLFEVSTVDAFSCRALMAYGQVSLPHAWRPEQDHVLPSVQEAELVQALDLLALDTGLEGEIELIERLHSRQPRGAHGGLETAVVAQHDLGVQELLDGLGRRDRAAVGS